MVPRPTYIFLDESGNFDFSPSGTRYFVMTSVSMKRPFPGYNELDEFKHECIETSHLPNLEYFHCANDRKPVRIGVFNRLLPGLSQLRVDSLVVEKAKTGPALQPATLFYPRMLGYLLKYVMNREQTPFTSELIIVTDTLPVQKQRKAVTKAIQQAIHDTLPSHMRYRIIHHASRAHYGLQIADYFCWALYRKWERSDTQHYDLIKAAIRSEFDIFRTGTTYYY